jgi:3-isopropylmalate dehydrogenase
MYVDNAAMQLVRKPRQFDVLLTENTFGDILSDEASMLIGSLGMLSSASLGEDETGKRNALYEPSHGSAPDIAGQNKANPIATILSLALMLETTFQLKEAATCIHDAIGAVLDSGRRTVDIADSRSTIIGTDAMGDAICEAVLKGASVVIA